MKDPLGPTQTRTEAKIGSEKVSDADWTVTGQSGHAAGVFVLVRWVRRLVIRF